MTTAEAVMRMAETEGWDKRTLREVGLLLWSLFRYYAIRAGAEQ